MQFLNSPEQLTLAIKIHLANINHYADLITDATSQFPGQAIRQRIKGEVTIIVGLVADLKEQLAASIVVEEINIGVVLADDVMEVLPYLPAATEALQRKLMNWDEIDALNNPDNGFDNGSQ